MDTPAIWRVRYDLAWTRLLLWIARAGVVGDPKPEIHAYLALLYHHLADDLDERGRFQKAGRLRRIAREHELQGPPDLPPPAAMRMPRPRPPVLTDARGEQLRSRSSRKGGTRTANKPARLRSDVRR